LMEDTSVSFTENKKSRMSSSENVLIVVAKSDLIKRKEAPALATTRVFVVVPQLSVRMVGVSMVRKSVASLATWNGQVDAEGSTHWYMRPR